MALHKLELKQKGERGSHHPFFLLTPMLLGYSSGPKSSSPSELYVFLALLVPQWREGWTRRRRQEQKTGGSRWPSDSPRVEDHFLGMQKGKDRPE